MSEDNNKTISEETISAIVGAAQNIATDSDAMRQSMVAIADALQPAIQRAGIEFEAGGMWDDNSEIAAARYYYRLVVVKRHQWELVIEADHSQSINCTVDESRVYGGTQFIGFDKAARWLIAEALTMLPAFLNEYAAELKRRHQRYSDLREKAEQFSAIMEETV